MRELVVMALLLPAAVACNRSASAKREAPAPARREASVSVTLEQVNATPCTRDADCGISPTPCQSGCGHPGVNKASPLYGAFLETIRRENRCCRPNSECPVTACAQTRTRPVCRKGSCRLVEPR